MKLQKGVYGTRIENNQYLFRNKELKKSNKMKQQSVDFDFGFC